MSSFREAERKKENILKFLAQNCYYVKTSNNNFTLTSGLESKEYIECEKLFYNFSLLESVISILPFDHKSNVVGGPGSGAIPMIIGGAKSCKFDYWFYYDKDKTIKGYIPKHYSRITILEDVTTTGKSVLNTIDTLYEYSKTPVVEIITLVDREQGAKEAIEKQYPNIWFKSIFTLYDVRKMKRKIDSGLL